MDNHNELSETLYINEQGKLTDTGLSKEVYITGMGSVSPAPVMLHQAMSYRGFTEGFYKLKGVVFAVNVDLIFKA